MNVKKTVGQHALVSKKFGKNCVVGTLTALAVLVSTPVFSNTVNTTPKAVAKQKTTPVLNRKSSRRNGRQIYICSPAGFGKKSSCYLR